MKKKIRSIVLSVLTLSLSTIAMAQTNIAVVDVEDAILRSDYAKERMEELNKMSTFKNLVSEFNAAQADIEAMQEEQIANASKWDAKQRADFQERLVYLREDYESAAKKLNAKRQQIYEAIVRAMQEKARIGLKEIIASEKIGLLIDAKAVLLKTPDFDITEKLIRKLNKTQTEK